MTLMLAVFGVQLNTTRNFLLTQQSAEVNNTVNSMGLALAPYLESNDKIASESVINALFDGGYYQKVQLKMLADNSEIVREYPVNYDGIPHWFTDLNLFPAIEENRTLTSGWLQLAEVTVVSHPGFAYRELWKATTQLASWFGLTLLIAALIIALQLKHSLSPLKVITHRAREIANNRFGNPIELPKTADLRTVVQAINSMSTKLQQYFEAQAKEAEKLREKAYQDAVSGLGNRNFFMAQLRSWVHDGGEGGIALIKVEQIDKAYDDKGFAEGDSLVASIANRINTSLSLSEATTARIGRDEFALILPGVTADDLKQIGSLLLDTLRTHVEADVDAHLAIGLVANDNQTDVGKLLSQADNALAMAKQNPAQPLHLIRHTSSSNVMGKTQWKTLVEEAISEGLFVYKYQPAVASDRSPLHREVFTAIEKGEHFYGAGQFLNAIEQLKMGEHLDRHVISRLLVMLNSGELVGPVAVNLTTTSSTSASFLRWLTEKLSHAKNLSGQLLFEIPESVFVYHQDNASLLADSIVRLGFGFGVDNYGRHFESLDYIKDFQPSYVKIDFAYTADINDEDKRMLLSSISRTANNLGITTIATRVETEQQLQQLSELYVDGFQGFVFDKQKS
ncbi:EAL domain-containing protein [Parasalinivibrio latis]|uniref:bifunctional diguanylate cyclase/phosphodiesterase n=1 Tax=Parasalinivibrio latis TaxID=2952610 RepID=UPI0030DE78B2